MEAALWDGRAALPQKEGELQMSNLRKSCSPVAAMTVGAAALLVAALPAEAQSITVVSGGGAYSASQIEAYHKPFAEETGTTVNSADYNFDLGPIRAQVEAGNVHWDVADVEEHQAIRGCAEGLFEELDVASLAPAADGTPAQEDFIEGTYSECAIGTILFSTIYAYDERQFPDGEPQPTTLSDFFDVENFPGRRGLQSKGQGTLEFALMADGVAPEDVYDVLSTEEGMNRAFSVLEKVKDDAVWWETGAQSVQILADGEVAMTISWNGRIQTAIDEDQLPVKIVWDNQMWMLNMWSIPKGGANVDLARQFVEFASQPERMADQANYIPYAPVRQSALELVPEDIARTLPTYPENFANALKFDASWWADHGDRTENRFTSWLAR